MDSKQVWGYPGQGNRRHILQPAKALHRMGAFVKTGGTLIVTSPNGCYLPDEEETHLHSFTLDQLRQVCAGIGLVARTSTITDWHWTRRSSPPRSGRFYVNPKLTPEVSAASAPAIHRFPDWHHVQELTQTWWVALRRMVLWGDPSPKLADVPWRFHAWFESIHPFIDGNGRAGRVVMWNIEALAGRDLTIVRYDERYNYYDRLQAWRNENTDLGV